MARNNTKRKIMLRPTPHALMRTVLFTIMVLVLLTIPAILFAQLAPITPFAGTSQLSLIDAIRNIVNALLTLAALVAAIYIVIGGVRYISSQGDENATTQAKGTIIYAVIGIIVIALSAVLVNFIIANLQ